MDQQIKGTFEIDNEQLKRYAEAMDKLKAEFQEVILQKILWIDNQKVNELSKLASALATWDIEEPAIQEQLIAQVNQTPRPAKPAD